MRQFKDSKLTQERLKSLLSYDPISGSVRWREYRSGTRSFDREAGHLNEQGYRMLCVDREHILAHRVIWMYVHGRWPLHFIDHIDGNRSNNSIANLREASDLQNARNALAKGFYLEKRVKSRPYVVEIKVRRKKIQVGRFATESAARTAYLEATRKYFGEFSAADRMESSC